jgi:Na+/H+-dicarboxylate symporter
MEIIIALVFIIILFVCSIVTLTENEILEDTDFTQTILGIFTGCSMIAMFLIIAYLCKPKAIDVYRDKTTLEITYKNSVPIDTVVVWKGK